MFKIIEHNRVRTGDFASTASEGRNGLFAFNLREISTCG
jgi:hypothetical protein